MVYREYYLAELQRHAETVFEALCKAAGESYACPIKVQWGLEAPGRELRPIWVVSNGGVRETDIDDAPNAVAACLRGYADGFGCRGGRDAEVSERLSAIVAARPFARAAYDCYEPDDFYMLRPSSREAGWVATKGAPAVTGAALYAPAPEAGRPPRFARFKPTVIDRIGGPLYREPERAFRAGDPISRGFILSVGSPMVPLSWQRACRSRRSPCTVQVLMETPDYAPVLITERERAELVEWAERQTTLGPNPLLLNEWTAP